MTLGKRWFGFALAALTVCLVLCGVAATPIGILPADMVTTTDTTSQVEWESRVDTLLPAFRDAFEAGLEEQLTAVPRRTRLILQIAYGASWQDVIRRHTLEHSWPVLRKHAATVLCEMATKKLDVSTRDGMVYFNAAMLQRRPAIDEELRQLLKDANVGTSERST